HDRRAKFLDLRLCRGVFWNDCHGPHLPKAVIQPLVRNDGFVPIADINADKKDSGRTGKTRFSA
ncbi:MAG: hypothetical protein AAFY39_14415, partial [Pseudomonadota bacterium]